MNINKKIIIPLLLTFLLFACLLVYLKLGCNPLSSSYAYTDFMTHISTIEGATLEESMMVAPNYKSLPKKYQLYSVIFGLEDGNEKKVNGLTYRSNIGNLRSNTSEMVLFKSENLIFSAEIIILKDRVIAMNILSDEDTLNRVRIWHNTIKDNFPKLSVRIIPVPDSRIEYYRRIGKAAPNGPQSGV